MAVLAIVALGLNLITATSHKQSVQLNSREACQQTARNIATNIKTFDNDVTVRNWFPNKQNGNADVPAPSSKDPFCSGSRANSLCANQDLVSRGGVGLLNPLDFFNFLNRRNAATWAYTIYNLSKSGDTAFAPSADPSVATPDPCSIYLADFDPLYLPTPVTKSSVFGDYDGVITLRLKQVGSNGTTPANCSMAHVAPLEPYYFQLQIGLHTKHRGASEWEQNCAVDTSIGYIPDNSVARLNVVFKNMAGAAFPALSTNPAAPVNMCIDPATGRPYNNGFENARGLLAELSASEPGVYFRCSVSGPGDATAPPMNKCSVAQATVVDLTTGTKYGDGDFGFENYTQDFNARPVGAFQVGGLPPRTPLPYTVTSPPQVYSFAFELTDTGRNQSRTPAGAGARYYFKLESTCPASDQYCPSPAPQPIDGCSGGACPQSTRKGQGCPSDPRLVCPRRGDAVCDDCGQPNTCPDGTKGVVPVVGIKSGATFVGTDPNTPDCPPADTYYSCEKRYGWCGQLCPPGTKPVPAPDPGEYCKGTFHTDLCGGKLEGTIPATDPRCLAASPPTPSRSLCPPASEYCTNNNGANPAGPATHFYNWDGNECNSGTFEGGGPTASIGCPDPDQYCPGAGQQLWDSCGRVCPSGNGTAPGVDWCCGGCNSAGDPPSFKRLNSCTTYANTKNEGGTCVHDLVTNCNQYVPPSTP